MILNTVSKITPLTNEKVATFLNTNKSPIKLKQIPIILVSYELNVNLS